MDDISDIKAYDELKFSDDYSFCAITTDERVARGIAQVTTGHILRDIKVVSAQTEVRNDPNTKSIRTDVLLESSDVIFDYEMQNEANSKIYDRARAYLGIIDALQLKRGEDFDKLKTVYIQFFCRKDPFGEGIPIYTFPDDCKESPRAGGKSRGIKVIYNCTAWAKVDNPELRAFMRYIQDGTVSSDFTKLIDDLLKELIKSAKGRRAYMDTQMVLREHERKVTERVTARVTDGIVLNMLKSSVSLDNITKWTGLTPDRIEELRASMVR